jgi:hypothetical protein
VIFEVSAKIGRHFWANPPVPMDAEDWDRLPDRFGFEPAREAERREMASAVRRAVDEQLTLRQWQVFVAIVLDGVPLDALAVRLGSTRNAICGAAAADELREDGSRQPAAVGSEVALLSERRVLRADSLAGREDCGFVTTLMPGTERSGRLIGPAGRLGLLPDEGQGRAH